MPLCIDRRIGWLRIRDVFFSQAGEVPPYKDTDLLHFLQSSTPSGKSTEFYTSLIDLQKTEFTLFEEIQSGFRYDIRKAVDKDNFNSVFQSPDDECLSDFIEFYNKFATTRKLNPANRNKLRALMDAGALVLSWVPDTVICDDSDKRWICAHAYITNDQRARLYYSCNTIDTQNKINQQRIGRANKLMHWQAIINFKAQGLSLYDMGGISMSTELQGIDKFKRSFGGELVREYNNIESTSAIGMIALALLELNRRLTAVKSSFVNILKIK